MRSLPAVIFLLLCPCLAWGQQLRKPTGSFSRDSIKLGALVEYALVHRHHPAQEVILPDSGYSFAPFELVQKRYFPTQTRNGISTDSAVYTLRTFETNSIQQLALPVFVLTGQDTVQLASVPDTVLLHQLVTEVKEPLVIKSVTGLAFVEERFNWPNLVLWTSAGILLLCLIWLIFGETIKIKYTLYRLRKDYVYFSSRYNTHVDRLVKAGYSQSIEKAVTLWKNYLTKLERSAINSFTTKEIVVFYNDNEEINNALRLCDKAIYGNIAAEADEETRKALSLLRRFAKRRYKFQREITANAKKNRRSARLAESRVV
ncbi:hypothetical protein [Botryobacter ruber]|uniref:hypothetical protein n=1 Tax=Botryobacter ruber TaxID=2171629 RepID=UPI000F6506F0|nr:hypothetical protein [Botryobacter ruber]